MTPYLADPDVTLYHGDCLEVLRTLPDRSVHMCATSPPFYGLRDYGTEGQIGLEETPDQWVERLVAVFREVRRVLRDDGTLWVEIGDSYCANQGRGFNTQAENGYAEVGRNRTDLSTPIKHPHKQKDLLGQPWLLAFALRADGWYLRSEIIWARPNPMPESVTDRPTKSHSTVFLLSKQPRYFYDADAIRTEPDPQYAQRRFSSSTARDGLHGVRPAIRSETDVVSVHSNPSGANARSVWNIPTEPTPFAHFATWPRKLVARMILAGTSERGCCPECGAPWVRETTHEYEHVNHTAPRDQSSYVASHAQVLNKHVTTVGWSPSCECLSCPRHGVPREGLQACEDCERSLAAPPPVPCTVLDPFAGSATTNLVARNHGRHSIGIELNPDYCRLAAERLQQLSLLAEGAA